MFLVPFFILTKKLFAFELRVTFFSSQFLHRSHSPANGYDKLEAEKK